MFGGEGELIPCSNDGGESDLISRLASVVNDFSRAWKIILCALCSNASLLILASSRKQIESCNFKFLIFSNFLIIKF